MINIVNKKITTLVIISLLICLIVIHSVYREKMLKNKFKDLKLNEYKSTLSNKQMESNKKIKVYISGAIKNPGLYYVSKGSTLKELIEKHLILKGDINIKNLKLDQKLFNGETVIIPN